MGNQPKNDRPTILGRGSSTQVSQGSDDEEANG